MSRDGRAPDFVSKFDHRLNAFESVPVILDFQKTYQKVFNPINLQETTRIVRLHDADGFLDPQSAMLTIKGRILKNGSDGKPISILPTARMTKLTVSQLK